MIVYIWIESFAYQWMVTSALFANWERRSIGRLKFFLNYFKQNEEKWTEELIG